MCPGYEAIHLARELACMPCNPGVCGWNSPNLCYLPHTYIIIQLSLFHRTLPRSLQPHPRPFQHIIKAVAHLMKLKVSGNSQRMSCSFLLHVSGQHSGFVTCHRGMELPGWYAWMPRWWIVINYHQVELSGWCTTGSGIFFVFFVQL